MLSTQLTTHYQYITDHGQVLLLIALAWSFINAYVFAGNWRKYQHPLSKTLALMVTTMATTFLYYLPFLLLAFAVMRRWL